MSPYRHTAPNALPPSLQVFLFQKAVLYKCNMAGKPAVLTRVVDTMTETPRPTRAEATDVANAVLDGTAHQDSALFLLYPIPSWKCVEGHERTMK